MRALFDAVEGVLSGSTEKRFRLGQHRSCSPAETIERVRPLLAPCGITRVANVTGLDRLGIPVVIAVRPNARSLSISQGKGIDLAAARASALMEALENHHAEQPDVEVRVATFRALSAHERAVDPERLRRSGSHVSPQAELRWVCGYDLCAGRPVWVPVERVHVDYTEIARPDSGVVINDSNGLASGNTLAEAILHGLLELIERDSCALAAHRRAHGAPVRWVDPTRIPDQLLQDVLERCRHGGVTVTVADATTDTGIPVYEAGIGDVGGGMTQRLPGPLTVWGGGCHVDPAIALLRAITEAAQARLTYVVGSREDLGARHYADPFTPSSAAAPTSVEPAPIDSPGACGVHATIEQDIAAVLDRLRACGVDEVIAVDLSPMGHAIAVVRVIAPDLEGCSWSPQYVPGPRALAITA